jgi:hypothetical protein
MQPRGNAIPTEQHHPEKRCFQEECSENFVTDQRADILRTANSTSPVLAISLLPFFLVYGVLFSMGIYCNNRLIAMGPTGPSIIPPKHGTPTRRLSAVEEAGREALASGT